MKSKAAYFPLGLVFGLGLGSLFGNPALGALLGMLGGLVISSRKVSNTRDTQPNNSLDGSQIFRSV